MKKVLLAYSGGLDTSCILKWIKEEYDAEVIAYCADVGQAEDFEALKKKALTCGAIDCIVDDLKSEFVSQYIYPAIKAGAVYEKEYLLGTSLARPCIAKGMVEAALRNNCDAIAHGATGKGNDQVRFELAVKALAPHLKVLAPWRIWPYEGRADLFEYAEKHGIELPITKDKPYSMDANLMHISYEGGILEDPWAEPPEDMFLWTKSLEDASDTAEYVEIEFVAGMPVAINNQKLKPLELIQTINEIGASHGIGRVDLVENRYIGIKSRGVYETPGVTILYKAHQAIESLTIDKEVCHLKEALAQKLAELVYNGYWFAPETKILLNAVEDTQKVVTGIAMLKLYKGNTVLKGRCAPASLYDMSLSSFETMTSIAEFSPCDSGGFININGLRLSTWSKVNESIEKGIHQTA
ncbi:MAG: argininosuccinate synthase [Candidatus Obscuribacterales bacterium]|nr:argininosuccinate synthase [Candidatus Obscuribacterales bacterium]